MIPFQQPTAQIFTAFFESTYKMCRFQQDLEESELDTLEKTMRQNMKNPQNIFRMIKNHSGKEADFPEGAVQVKETGVVVRLNPIAEEALDDFDDDLLEMGYKQDEPIPRLLSKLPAAYLTPEKQPLPVQIGKIQAKIQIDESDKQEDDDEEKDSIDQELKIANQAYALAHKSCRFHISGAYKERIFKTRAGKSTKYLKCPILLLKDREDGKEYVIPNCDFRITQGEVQTLLEHLRMQRGGSEKENVEMNEEE